jgi:capsule polysaccharide export protein KpsE/RkpR
MESSDISQESASTVSAKESSVMGEEASSSSADVSSNVEQQETVEDYVESSRSQEQSQKRSMEMEEDYSTREFGFGTRAEFGFCGRRIQRNRNVRYFSGCECRKCFEFTREFGFGNGKQ